MIRVNLLPNRKRGARTRSAAPSEDRVTYILVGMAVGWAAMALLGFWLLAREEAEMMRLRAETATVTKQVEKIRKRIDEEGLQAKQDRVQQLTIAIEKLEAQQRTPMFVLHEFANILTPGELPDLDPEEQRRRVDEDAEAGLDPNWDGHSVWISKFEDRGGGTYQIDGSAKDASDLSEFVKRLRASARFGQVTHPDYQITAKKGNAGRPGAQYLKFKLSVRVKYWD